MSTAQRFSPLKGGRLPVGEIKTKNTQCDNGGRGFGFAWLPDTTEGYNKQTNSWLGEYHPISLLLTKKKCI